jgi:hypothetical protein
MPSPPLVGGRLPVQVSEEKYSAAVIPDPRGIRVAFRGTISTVNPGMVLNPFVDAVHDHAVAQRATEVQVDFRDLEFCNSSGFKSFIHWIQRINETPVDGRYQLRFLATASRKWQRTSLLALSCYGVNTVVIDN